MRKYSNSGTQTERSTFSRAFWFFSFLVRTEQRQHVKERKKERSNERERERERTNEREKERENERERTNERESRRKKATKKTQPQKHTEYFCLCTEISTHTTNHFLRRKKKHRKRRSSLSQHIMASPEAAAILRELQGKNGNGVRF